MIVVFAGEKGGTGKSTISTNIAQIRKTTGHKVLFIDLDLQGSARVWRELRGENEGLESPDFQVVTHNTELAGNDAYKAIIELSNYYDDVVIDVGGRDSQEMRAAFIAAGKVYSPIRASQYDVSTLEKMQTLSCEAKDYNPDLQTFVFINQASTNARMSEHRDAQKIIESDALPDLMLSGAVIHDRVAFRKATEQGLGVCELPKSKAEKAQKEIMKLYKEIFSHEA